MKDDRVYLKHILRCIHRIEEYTSEGRSAFFSSHLIQDATLRNLQTMAESTQQLNSRLKALRPEVDWKALSGFRNILVHDYLGTDMNLVYRAIMVEMPKLKQAAEAILEQIQNGSSFD